MIELRQPHIYDFIINLGKRKGLRENGAKPSRKSSARHETRDVSQRFYGARMCSVESILDAACFRIKWSSKKLNPTGRRSA